MRILCECIFILTDHPASKPYIPCNNNSLTHLTLTLYTQTINNKCSSEIVEIVPYNGIVQGYHINNNRPVDDG